MLDILSRILTNNYCTAFRNFCSEHDIHAAHYKIKHLIKHLDFCATCVGLLVYVTFGWWHGMVWYTRV